MNVPRIDMGQFNVASMPGSYLGVSGTHPVMYQQHGFLLPPQQGGTSSTPQLFQIVQVPSNVTLVPASTGVVLQQPYLEQLSCVGTSGSELLVAQAPAGSREITFTAGVGGFSQTYAPAPAVCAAAPVEPVTEETVDLEYRLLQQQLTDRQQLAQQKATEYERQAQQQLLSLQLSQHAFVCGSSAGSDTVQLLHPDQQQLLGGTAGSASCSFGTLCSEGSFASVRSGCNPASTSGQLTPAPFLQAQQQQQQAAQADSAAAVQQLPCSSGATVLAALLSQSSLGSNGSSSYARSSDGSGDTASGSSKAGFRGPAENPVSCAGSYDRDAAKHGSHSGGRTIAGSWHRSDGLIVVPCMGGKLPNPGPKAGAAAPAAQSAHGTAAASSRSGGRVDVVHHVPRQQERGPRASSNSSRRVDLQEEEPFSVRMRKGCHYQPKQPWHGRRTTVGRIGMDQPSGCVIADSISMWQPGSSMPRAAEVLSEEQASSSKLTCFVRRRLEQLSQDWPRSSESFGWNISGCSSDAGHMKDSSSPKSSSSSSGLPAASAAAEPAAAVVSAPMPPTAAADGVQLCGQAPQGCDLKLLVEQAMQQGGKQGIGACIRGCRLTTGYAPTEGEADVPAEGAADMPAEQADASVMMAPGGR